MDELETLKARVESLGRDVEDLKATILAVMHTVDDHRVGRDRPAGGIQINPGDGGGWVDVN